MKLRSQVNQFTEANDIESLLSGIAWDISFQLLHAGRVSLSAHAETRCGHLVVSSDTNLEISGRLPGSTHGLFQSPSGAFFRVDRPQICSDGSMIVLSPGTRFRIIFEKGCLETVLLPLESNEIIEPPSIELLNSWFFKYRVFENRECFTEESIYPSPHQVDHRYDVVERTCRLIDSRDDVTRPSEISSCLNVGIRTLERVFAQSINMTPSRFLLARRLNKAFRTLRDSNPKKRSVTEVALEHHFSHLGRFSTNYRGLFGESPRDTLRKSR